MRLPAGKTGKEFLITVWSKEYHGTIPRYADFIREQDVPKSIKASYYNKVARDFAKENEETGWVFAGARKKRKSPPPYSRAKAEAFIEELESAEEPTTPTEENNVDQQPVPSVEPELTAQELSLQPIEALARQLIPLMKKAAVDSLLLRIIDGNVLELEFHPSPPTRKIELT